MSVIDDVKSRLDLVELISETVKLRKSGRAYMGLCPFHAHKNNTPSFAVWPDAGLWKCFGQCNEGGDGFKFVMKRDGVDFSEALRLLAARTGVTLEARTPAAEAESETHEQLRRLLETAATYFQHLLKNAPQAEAARRHLAGRGLTERAVELFQLGYALDEWEALLKFLSSKGYRPAEMLAAGVVVEKDDSRLFDRFRDRLMIPVRDEAGRLTGFQARALKPDAQPKFMNSPQTALFDKGRTLFGLHLARKPIREAGAAVVVEGNLDVIAAHQAGFSNVVSSQGTALTEHQLRLLKKYARRLILALDADEAGDAATLRGLDVARAALDREAEVTFDPRGLVKIEGRLRADIRIMTLPAGLDPDDVLRRDPAEWRALVEAAQPVVPYVIEALTRGRDLDDPKVKTDVAEAVLPLIEDVAQPIERDAYRQKLARVLKVDERALTGMRPAAAAPFATPRSLRSGGQAGAGGGPRRPAARPEPAERPESAERAEVPAQPLPETATLETYCLRSLLQQPALLYKADRELQAQGLPRLAPDDFVHTEHQMIFRALTTALEQFESDALEHLRDNLDPALEPRLASLLEPEPAGAADPRAGQAGEAARVGDALLNAVLRLRRRTLLQWLNELRFLAEDARDQGDARAGAYQLEIAQQARALAQVDRALDRRPARGPLPGSRLGIR